MDSPLLRGDVATLRRDLSSVKWGLYPADVLPLWVAEMDVTPCPAVVEAVTAAVRRGDTGYDLGRSYAAALSRFALDTWGWVIDPGAVVPVADVMIGVEALLRTVTDVDGPVVLSPPCYDSFFGFVATTGRPRIDAPLGADGRLSFDTLTTAFREAAASGRRAAYLLCSPQNPTGTVHTAEELGRLAGLAADYGVSVIADEIHAPLVHDGAVFTPFVTVPGGEHGFSVWSASKGWNLAGFKAALIVAGDGAVDRLRGVHEVHTHGVGHVGAIAQAAAVDGGREWRQQLLAELDANRRLLGDLIAAELPGVGYRRPEATYLAWLDCRDPALALTDDPARVFLERGHVALSSGPSYGAEAGRGFARLNFATSPEIIREAVTRMASAL